ncbi:hypothetical protein V8G54_002876 [Vigna mungo]|uniref:MSP domain-containing protein n=1 Tax=Vigna mungo TaxID=3915 RepID=A0AAQ3SB82_VIGMU
MSSGELLNIEPLELKFPFELKKQISCSLQLSNKTDAYVAFKVKTTNPKKYCVRPNTGIVMPRSTCDVMVTMQAQKETPPDMQCKDKFLLQSVKTVDGASPKDITPEMFNKEAGHVVEESKLRVVYVSPPQPPSPVPEGSEEGSSPRGSVSENGNAYGSDFTQVVRGFTERPEAQDKLAEARALISRLTEEKNNAIEQNSKLRQELSKYLFMCRHCCIWSSLYITVSFGSKERLNAMILLLVGSTEAGRQQKSWSIIYHCRINWLTWHNNGVPLEEDLSISVLQFDRSFFIPDFQAIMRIVKIE